MTLTFPHDATTIALLAITALVAGTARGFSGFGAALIFVPLASALIGPQQAAPLLLLTDGVVALPLIHQAWGKAVKRDVGLMAFGAIFGIPLGTAVLAMGDPLVLRWFIVALVAAMLVLLLSGWRYLGKPHDIVTSGVGLLSGLFSGIAQIGGPPVVAYWIGRDHPPEQMRASTILYFAISTVMATVAYLLGRLLTFDTLLLALCLVPFFGIGLIAGSRMFGMASADIFRRICLGLIGLSLALSLPLWG